MQKAKLTIAAAALITAQSPDALPLDTRQLRQINKPAILPDAQSGEGSNPKPAVGIFGQRHHGIVRHLRRKIKRAFIPCKTDFAGQISIVLGRTRRIMKRLIFRAVFKLTDI